MKKSMTALVIVVLLLSITLFSCSNRTPEAAVAYVDYADGSEETDTLIIKNGKVTLPRSPQRDGYDFDGWLVNGTLYKYPSSASVQNGTTITAKWTKLCTVTVKYHIDGVADSSETVRSGESYTLPGSPKKENHVFTGWTIGEEKHEASSSVKVEADIIIQAEWTPIVNHTVTVVYGTDYGHSTVKQTVRDGEPFTLPVSPSREGYEFDGWEVGETDLHKYPYSIEVTGDRTITAKWTKLYTVTVNYNIDGLSEMTETVRDGGTYTLPTVPAQETVKFKAWKIGEDEKGSGEPVTVTSDTSVSAVWEDKTRYNVTYAIGDEGSRYSFTVGVFEGNTMEYLEKAYEREGCTIVWTCGSDSFDITTPIEHDYTGTSVITGTYTPIQFTVKFDSNGGSEIADKTVNYGEAVTKPDNPTKTGYTFKGWTLSGSDYLFDTPVKSDITLTAVWEINSYKVTFDSKGGSDIVSQTVVYKNYATAPEDPEREGYTFEYWTLGGEKFDFKATPVTGNIILEAKWQVITCYVTFDSGNISVKDPDTQTLEYGKLAYKPQLSAPDGLALKGWLIKDTTTYFDFNTQIKKTYSLVADWGKACTITIKDSKSLDAVLKTESVGEGAVYDVEAALGYKVTACTDTDGSTHSAKFTVDGDVTLYVQKGEWLTYSVGDNGPAGGRIFYVNTNSSASWRYLEAALSDFDETYSILGDSSALSSYSNDTDFGCGSSNTLYLEGNENSAAAECASFSYGGFSDWFLPSLAELREMFKESSAVKGIAGEHLSSSIASGAEQKVYTVKDGAVTSSVPLSTKAAVRAVRMF